MVVEYESDGAFSHDGNVVEQKKDELSIDNPSEGSVPTMRINLDELEEQKDEFSIDNPLGEPVDINIIDRSELSTNSDDDESDVEDIDDTKNKDLLKTLINFIRLLSNADINDYHILLKKFKCSLNIEDINEKLNKYQNIKNSFIYYLHLLNNLKSPE